MPRDESLCGVTHVTHVAGDRHTVDSNGDALRQLIAVLADKRRDFAKVIDA